MTNHRSQIDLDPSQYEYKFDFYCGNSEDGYEVFKYDHEMYEYMETRNLMDRRGRCEHCGAAYAWGSIFLHTPTGEDVLVGHTCAANRFHLPSKAVWDHKRRLSAFQRARHYGRNQRKAREFIEEKCPDLSEILDRDFELNDYPSALRDIAAKLWKWGSISEKQVAFCRKLAMVPEKRAWYLAENPDVAPLLTMKLKDLPSYEDDPDFEESTRDAFIRQMQGSLREWGSLTDNQAAALRKYVEREEEKQSSLKDLVLEEGRQEITGVVGNIKWVENAWGGADKTTLTTEEGFRVWGTVPLDSEWKTGDIVTIRATITRSKDDPMFGFFKRPHRINDPQIQRLKATDWSAI